MAQAAARSRGSRGKTRRPSLKVVGKSIAGEKWDEKKAIEALDDAYLECRSRRSHWWKTMGFYNSGGLATEVSQCERCTTKRTTWYTRTGYIEGNKYEYPDGYQITGHGPISTVAMRSVRLGRVKVYRSETEMLNHVMNGGGRRR